MIRSTRRSSRRGICITFCPVPEDSKLLGSFLYYVSQSLMHLELFQNEMLKKFLKGINCWLLLLLLFHLVTSPENLCLFSLSTENPRVLQKCLMRSVILENSVQIFPSEFLGERQCLVTGISNVPSCLRKEQKMKNIFPLLFRHDSLPSELLTHSQVVYRLLFLICSSNMLCFQVSL